MKSIEKHVLSNLKLSRKDFQKVKNYWSLKRRSVGGLISSCRDNAGDPDTPLLSLGSLC